MKRKSSVVFYVVLIMVLVMNLLSSLTLERRIRSISGTLGQVHSQRVTLNAPSIDKLDTLYTDVVNKVLPCVVEISNAKGKCKGTGFIFNKKKGYILTAEHVVKVTGKSGHITKDGRKIKILDIYSDPVNDFAVVLADVNDFGYFFYSQLELEDIDNINVGTPVLAFGHPYRRRYSVSLGIVSALNRKWSFNPKCRFLQTDAAINPGNSGGPLVNLHGRVVGIMVGIHFAKAPQNTGVSLAVNTESMQQSLKGFEGWLKEREEQK